MFDEDFKIGAMCVVRETLISYGGQGRGGGTRRRVLLAGNPDVQLRTRPRRIVPAAAGRTACPGRLGPPICPNQGSKRPWGWPYSGPSAAGIRGVNAGESQGPGRGPCRARQQVRGSVLLAPNRRSGTNSPARLAAEIRRAGLHPKVVLEACYG